MDRGTTKTDKPVTRTCRFCGEDKSLDEYYINTGYRMYVCKSCHNARTKAWRKTPAGRASVSTSDRSETGKARYRRYRQTDKYQAAQNKYQNSDKGKTTARKCLINYRNEHPNRHKANNAVNNAIAKGELPRASTLACMAQLEYCTGDAMEYHHHNGYDEEHTLDVVPVCATCHRELDSKLAYVERKLKQINS